MTRRPIRALVAILLGCHVLRPSLPHAQTAFKTGVEAVRMDAAVTRGGQPVRNLSASDFVVTDNGVVQHVESVAVDALPLSVFLVLDTSGSVAGEKLASLIDAGKMLTASLRPDDRAALVTFDEKVAIRAPLASDFGRVTTALSALSAHGPTAIRDAVHIALQLRPDDESRPVILVFSDGEDTSSWVTTAGLVASARRAGVVIHAVSLFDDRAVDVGLPGRASLLREPEGSRFLDQLVKATGGRQWPAAGPRDLQPLFVRALDEMRARYLLTFYAEGVAREGWHELKVTLKSGRADVVARPGYFVPTSR